MKKRFAVLMAGCFLLANTGSAYYYYTYFNSSSSPYTPIVARFDLTTLTNNTVPFFVSGAGPASMYQGDSFQAIISQITAAANVWNNVSTSSIRLAFGGLYNPGTTESAPGVQIEFSDDIPPGLLAVSAPQTFGNLAPGPNGTFIPVYLSLMELPTNLNAVFNGPSYSEEFFVTVVHEFGHTMGLQHTLASSVMSTYNTSAATKASPLGIDDIAGISLLYPAGNYLSTVGTISGRVTLNGSGVNLASVVAISSTSQAIATLTNPDGTYQLNGVPTGSKGEGLEYYVYVHPLPPPVEGEGSPDNIFYPHNSNGVFLAPNTGFVTQFYSGGQSGAEVIKVVAGKTQKGINFNVAPSSCTGRFVGAHLRLYSGHVRDRRTSHAFGDHYGRGHWIWIVAALHRIPIHLLADPRPEHRIDRKRGANQQSAALCASEPLRCGECNGEPGGAGAEAYVVQYARQSVYPSVGVHGGSGAFADHQRACSGCGRERKSGRSDRRPAIYARDASLV